MRIVSEYKEKRKFPFGFVIAAVLLILVVGSLVGYHMYDEYHTYKSDAVTKYEPVEAEQGDYVLTTEKKELLGKVYVGFFVKKKDTGEMIYQCPELYLVGELSFVKWKDGSEDIVVGLKDGTEVVYVGEDGSWSSH